MVFVPLWIHDDGLVRMVTDVDELQAKVDEGVGDIEKCDGAKIRSERAVAVETMFLFGERELRETSSIRTSREDIP